MCAWQRADLGKATNASTRTHTRYSKSRVLGNAFRYRKDQAAAKRREERKKERAQTSKHRKLLLGPSPSQQSVTSASGDSTADAQAPGSADANGRRSAASTMGSRPNSVLSPLPEHTAVSAGPAVLGRGPTTSTTTDIPLSTMLGGKSRSRKSKRSGKSPKHKSRTPKSRGRRSKRTKKEFPAMLVRAASTRRAKRFMRRALRTLEEEEDAKTVTADDRKCLCCGSNC